ncbi:hypothetical protein EDM22_05060 [Agromyces tardus]|uniref:Uncharacterized protein n=1 Tax=Agromyces tardus TaxID=2583849 RepID=A0A3M8AIR3_9MICO|nr:hypothetical protein EDM22_05060 [Agromyces tardus]
MGRGIAQHAGHPDDTLPAHAVSAASTASLLFRLGIEQRLIWVRAALPLAAPNDELPDRRSDDHS